MPPPLLEAENVTKRFGRILANDRIHAAFRAGSIHAVLGENGAGKTTFLKILYGLLTPDTGFTARNGRAVQIRSPSKARELGIGLIPQRLMIIPALSVMENLYLGHRGFRRLRPPPWSDAVRRVGRLMDQYQLHIPLEGRGDDLSVGQAQRLQILRALLQDARVLLCDEPTSVLAPPEVESLLLTLRRLRQEGAAIVFITHKLTEAVEVADEVTVLRAGRVVGGGPVDRFDEEKLAGLIVGQSRVEPRPRRERPAGDVRLRIESLVTGGAHGLGGLSLEVASGRIVGVAGVEGNGQKDLLEVLGGLRSWDSGFVELGGARTAAPGPLPARSLGAIPDDRMGLGLVADFSLRDNVLLGSLDRRAVSGRVFLRGDAVDRATERIVSSFGVRPGDPSLPAGALSGGNQQRLLVGREILRGDAILVASQPTQGVDVGSRDAIHAKLLEERDGGRAVLLISSDLEEVLRLSDEVHVLYRGRVLYSAAAGDVHTSKLARAMVGLEGARV